MGNWGSNEGTVENKGRNARRNAMRMRENAETRRKCVESG